MEAFRFSLRKKKSNVSLSMNLMLNTVSHGDLPWLTSKLEMCWTDREDLYPSGSSVLKLTSSNWDEEVEKREFVIIVNFYNPGCSHCVDFKDAYENIAKSFKDVIPVSLISYSC